MKYTSHLKQLPVDMFRSSFDKLDKNNRWVKLGDLLLWTELEKVYNSRLDYEVKGAGKRAYRANNIRAKLPETAECWTGMCYFVKNVMKFLRELCLALFEIKLNLWADAIAKFRVRCFAVMAIY